MISLSSSQTQNAGTPLTLKPKLVVVGSVGHWWTDFERKEKWFDAECVIRFA